ncbi:MAG: hypothetical protein A2166_05565 [Omnitrophica WOR_2 bacterium RBG_13_41_10]|nr:MAG: hypothetical protein A2166_05565 [Omnitrophica WOR_2 bacterium RBG_13_41_10]
MKRYGFIIIILIFGIYLAGCGRQHKAQEESQEFVSMEELGSNIAQPTTTPAEVLPAQTTSTVPQIQPEPPIPAGPYKPAAQEIQTALKNAGFYAGNIDGKIGPVSKKAIEEFQNASGLVVDGKVGPKTWEALSKHLNPTTPATKR